MSKAWASMFIDQYSAFSRVIKAVQESNNCGFPTPRRPNQCHCLTLANGKVQSGEHWMFWSTWVRKLHVLQLNGQGCIFGRDDTPLTTLYGSTPSSRGGRRPIEQGKYLITSTRTFDQGRVWIKEIHHFVLARGSWWFIDGCVVIKIHNHNLYLYHTIYIETSSFMALCRVCT